MAMQRVVFAASERAVTRSVEYSTPALQPPPIRLPSGVRDLLPRAAARRRSLADRVLAVFDAWGFARIITPVFECADVLERGLGHDARAAANSNTGVMMRANPHASN